MSNVIGTAEGQCDIETGCGAVELVLRPRDKDLGGFSVRRTLPTGRRKMVGPWIFFDHMGPAEFPAGEGINVRPHPHIGIATVTYLFEGEVLHRDSIGSVQVIRPGDINLMVAGKGIVHSERERPEVTAVPHRLHALQLWLALPEEDEEVDPAFHHYPAAEIPYLNVEGVPVRVMMGRAYGASSPVRVFADTLYLEAHLQAGQSLRLPQADERAIYIVEGQVDIEDTEVPEHAMAILSGKPNVTVSARSETRLAVIGGVTLPRRYIDWNFVSSSKERIAQAKQDWETMRFPLVPGDDEEFIPLPE